MSGLLPVTPPPVDTHMWRLAQARRRRIQERRRQEFQRAVDDTIYAADDALYWRRRLGAQ